MRPGGTDGTYPAGGEQNRIGSFMSRSGWLIIVAVAVLGVVGFQFKAISMLRNEVAALRGEIQEGQVEISDPAVNSNERQATRPVVNSTAGLQSRLASLERTVGELSKISEVLSRRGILPPSEERVAEMQQKFFDPSASERDRLRALQLMRRNRQIDDTVVATALNWLQTSTNGNTRRELLRQLDGTTNAAMKGPLMALLQTEQSGNVREELIDVLGDFAQDPAVESKLWELALNDPDGDVREEAQESLEDGPATPERIQRLQERAASPEASLDERLLSLRALREANVNAPEALNDLASLAQSSPDPVTRAKLYDAFDGINDPSLMAPLVNGLQDANPVVRERAADALGSFASDPRIQEWLNHVIQNDADPRVKREAHQALGQSQRRGRRGGG